MGKGKVPSGRHIGERIDPRTVKPIEVEEQEHFYCCAKCRAWGGALIVRDGIIPASRIDVICRAPAAHSAVLRSGRLDGAYGRFWRKH